MTPKYWIKIVLGMLAIFTVGMLVTSGIRRAKSEVIHIATTAEPLSIPLLGIPFQTARGELGQLRRLRIERDQPREIDGLHFTVQLNEGVDPDQFANCEVTVTDPQHFDSNTRFQCITAADVGFEDLVRFGSVTFEPSGDVHRLMLPREVRDAIATAFVSDADSAAAGDTLGVDSTDASVKLTVGSRTIVNVEVNQQ
ncbi:MAG TPA: hypothetical protein PLL69_10155 [Gemmatimonadales bacterium]|nr:hypothetical protein [Gemmatimonadales bacterium]